PAAATAFFAIPHHTASFSQHRGGPRPPRLLRSRAAATAPPASRLARTAKTRAADPTRLKLHPHWLQTAATRAADNGSEVAPLGEFPATRDTDRTAPTLLTLPRGYRSPANTALFN